MIKLYFNKTICLCLIDAWIINLTILNWIELNHFSNEKVFYNNSTTSWQVWHLLHLGTRLHRFWVLRQKVAFSKTTYPIQIYPWRRKEPSFWGEENTNVNWYRWTRPLKMKNIRFIFLSLSLSNESTLPRVEISQFCL